MRKALEGLVRPRGHWVPAVEQSWLRSLSALRPGSVLIPTSSLGSAFPSLKEIDPEALWTTLGLAEMRGVRRERWSHSESAGWKGH